MNARQHSCMNARMQIIPSAKALFCNCFSPLSSDEIFGPLNFRTSFFQLLDFADRKGVLFLVFLKGFPYSDSCTFHICSVIIIWDLKGGVLRTGYCLSQTNKKTDDFFICSLTTWICSSVNCLFKPFPIWAVFLLSICWNCCTRFGAFIWPHKESTCISSDHQDLKKVLDLICTHITAQLRGGKELAGDGRMRHHQATLIPESWMHIYRGTHTAPLNVLLFHRREFCGNRGG